MAVGTVLDTTSSAVERYADPLLESWLSGPCGNPESAEDVSDPFSSEAADRALLGLRSDRVPTQSDLPAEWYESSIAAAEGAGPVAGARTSADEVAGDGGSRPGGPATSDDGTRSGDGGARLGGPAAGDGGSRLGGPAGAADAAETANDRDGAACGVVLDPVGELRGVLDSVAALAEVDWHELAGRAVHDALDVVEQVDRRMAGLRAQVLATVEANGLWALDGSRTFRAWLQQRTDTTAGAASRQVRHSRALRDHLPLARRALEDGTIGQEHVGVLVREAITTDRLRGQLSDADLGEAFLVDQARVMDAGTFTKLVKAWAIAADPEGADRAWREADAKEELTLAPTLGGYHVGGWLDDLSGKVVAAALKAHMGRKADGDDRTPAQRRAAALVSLAHQSLDEGKQGAHARVRPHVTVTTTLDALRALAAAMGSPVPPAGPGGAPVTPGAGFGLSAEATLTAPGGPRDPDAPPQAEPFELSAQAREWVEGWQPGGDHVISAAIDHRAMIGVEPATLEDGTPIPPALLARLACESGLSRVVFGPDSTILDVGREKRIFPANMAKAIIARDRTCRYPGCDEPPGYGEIHHSLQWYRDHGPTDVEHGILLCWHHHDWVHAKAITIARSKGAWYFYDRHGWLITANRQDDDPSPTS